MPGKERARRMNILFNDFKKEYAAKRKGINSAVQKVLQSGYFILGQEVLKFEKDFARYLEVKHVIGVGNGMEAIEIALLALGIKKGDEVITTSLSAAATALAIKAVGATPVFADIDKYCHIDPKEIERKISKKTKAILPVHLYGQAADMSKIMALAKKYKLEVIEDCAQAHGAQFKGKRVGSLGIAGCFSFYPTKNLGAYGDGGAIATNNAELADKMRMIRNYGQKNRYEHPIYGLNSRLDELQAGILSVKLKQLDSENKKRNAIAKLYRQGLKQVGGLKLPEERGFVSHVYHLFVIETTNRNSLQEFLREKGIPTIIHYPIPIYKQKAFATSNKLNLPETKRVTDKILSLPCHPYLTNKEVRYICGKIKEFYS